MNQSVLFTRDFRWTLDWKLELNRFLWSCSRPCRALSCHNRHRLTYAAMHLVEDWSTFANPRDTVLSLLFVPLTYLGPGMFKSFVTLRTGNAWVHAIGATKRDSGREWIPNARHQADALSDSTDVDRTAASA